MNYSPCWTFRLAGQGFLSNAPCIDMSNALALCFSEIEKVKRRE